MSLYRNIAKKKARIKAGSKERMRKPGAKGAPSASAFKKAAKTAKKRK
jgi:cysteine sulfinate desulfinase/cysteine desulfurase-like protein